MFSILEKPKIDKNILEKMFPNDVLPTYIIMNSKTWANLQNEYYPKTPRSCSHIAICESLAYGDVSIVW